MPQLLWASDLHLDHLGPTGRRDLAALLPAGTPVVLTGDVSIASSLRADLRWLAAAAEAPINFVLGNHDHYGASIAAVRDEVVALAEENPAIRWLPPAGVVRLGDDHVLVGVDGWADGRHGDPLDTPVRLNDDRLIAELAAQPSRRARLIVRQALADADARRLATLLDRAVGTARHIVIATHVPPFVEALPRRGRLSGPEWLPLLVCEATGAVIRRVATENPQHDFMVLAGHTHVATEVVLAPNLRCRVAGARYGTPQVTPITLDP